MAESFSSVAFERAAMVSRTAKGEEAKYRAIVSQGTVQEAIVTIVGLDHASAAEETRLLFAQRINFFTRAPAF